MRKWFDNLPLQYKVNLQIQPMLVILLSVATFFIYQQMKSNILSIQAQRADGIAMQVIDSANMLMVTGAISNTGNRQLMIRKIIDGQHLATLRLLRTEQVVRQYGHGLPEEHLDDPLVKQTIERSVSAGKSIPHISIEMENGKPMLRAITPYIESHGFHGTDCLTCHHVAVGSSNGASDLRIDLSGNFKHLNLLLTRLIAGQIGLQLLLFFIITWAFTLKSQQLQLEHLAHYDTLTDLPNRRALDEEFDKTMARVRRHGWLLAVVMMDLDGFKPVNDIYGHGAGDKVLKIIAQRLRAVLRSTDFVARQGGDEFVLLIEACSNMDEIGMLLDKVDQAIRLPIDLGHGRVVGIAASAGVCLYPLIDTDNSDALLRYADQALYENKAHKNDRACFWTLYGDVTLPRENKM